MPSTYSLGGQVPIDDPTITGVYPLRPDFDVERVLGNSYVTHKISLLKEQRIRTTFDSNRWRLNHAFQFTSDAQAIIDFYDDHRHPSKLFYFYDPFEVQAGAGFVDLSGVSTIGRYVCKFADTTLSRDAFRHHLFNGQIEIVEVSISTTPISCPAFWSFKTDRYPVDFDGGIRVLEHYRKANLTDIRDIVPMVLIIPRTYSHTDATKYIRISDRLAHASQFFGVFATEVNGDYLPRLLDFEFTQEIGSGDTGTLVVDNSDGAFSALLALVNLERATVLFFVYKNNAIGGQWFHNMWQGYIATWDTSRNDGTLVFDCEGGLHGLKRDMPRRTCASTCPWEFDDGIECPYTAQGSGGNPTFCDKGLDTADGCISHGMHNYFGGLDPKPQIATGLLNDTGFWGFHRQDYRSTSTPVKSIASEVIPIVYGVGRQVIPAKIFETRDESEFFVAAGVFSEGTVGQVGQVLLDGQTMHPGFAPIIALGANGQNIGTHIDLTFRSSLTAFTSIRRVDEVGFKNPNEPHAILVEIFKGVPGTSIWWWTGPFANWGDVESSNPIHICFNFVLRSLGFYRRQFDANWVKDHVIELDAFGPAQDFCDQLVDSLTSAGQEKRFEFRGVVKDQKPAIDHLRDILANVPIDMVYSFGKIAFKPRKDDITVALATRISFGHLDNIIQGTFVAQRREEQFNEIKLIFSDVDREFIENSVTLYDEAQQKRIGWEIDVNTNIKQPLVKQTQLNLIGLFTKSQVVRLGTQLLREELGGATETEQLNARDVTMSVPVIGLAVEIGDISFVEHPDLPGGSAYVRWSYWRLTRDWKIDLKGTTVVPSMYGNTPPQLPSSNPSTQPSPGIPGTVPVPGQLTPPTLSQMALSCEVAMVRVSSGPLTGNEPPVEVPPEVPPPVVIPPPPPVGVTAPVPTTSTVNNDVLTINFDGALNATSIPAVSAFSVLVGAAVKGIDSVVVSGNIVQLNLSSPVVGGATGITVSYTQPVTNQLKGTNAAVVLSFSSLAVTNQTPIVGGPGIDDASFVSQSVPDRILDTNAQQLVTVTMRNTGNTTWTNAAGYKLISLNPTGNSVFGLSSVVLPLPGSVLPGATVVFSFNMTAPSSAGTYQFQWKMAKAGVAFGIPTSNIQIVVNTPIQVGSGSIIVYGGAASAGAGTEANPFKSPQSAFNIALPGQQILLKQWASAYDGNFRTPANRNGTASNPIIVRPYPGHSPVITWAGAGAEGAAISFDDVDYWVAQDLVVDGLGKDVSKYAIVVRSLSRQNTTGCKLIGCTVRNWGLQVLNKFRYYIGIWIVGGGEGHTVTNSQILNCLVDGAMQRGISANRTVDQLVQDTEVVNTRYGYNSFNNSPSAVGIQCGQGSLRAIIRRCQVHDHQLESNSALKNAPGHHGSVGLHADAGSTFGEIDDSDFYNISGINTGGHGIDIESGCSNWFIHDSRIYQVDGSGVTNGSATTNDGNDNVFQGLHIYDFGGAGFRSSRGFRTTVKNCIIQVSHNFAQTVCISFASQAVLSGGHKIDYNTYSDTTGANHIGQWGGNARLTFAQWKASSGQDAHSTG